jgi:uncharacterized protein YbjT (DUF2867 family)
MRTLILGGTGFVGRHVAAALLERGHDVGIGTRHPARAARRLPTMLRGCERLPPTGRPRSKASMSS